MAYPNPQDMNFSKGLGEILTYTDSVTNNWFFNLFLIAIFVIIAMAVYGTRNNIIEALALASFSTFIIALFLFLGELITATTFSRVIAFTLLGSLALFLDKKN